MQFINRVVTVLVLVCSPCAVTYAHMGITVCRTVDGRLVTGHGDYDNPQATEIPKRVFEGAFESTFTSHSPGFNAPETGDGLPSGYVPLPPETPLRFDPFAFTLSGGKTNLAYWDGNGDVDFTPVAGGTTLQVERDEAGLSVTLDGSATGVNGFDFAVTSAAGGLHEHLLFGLESAAGTPLEGIYLWSFELSMPGQRTSEPLFILHETPSAPLTLDMAVTWIEGNLDTLVPTLLSLAGDANGDGVVSGADLDLVRADWGRTGEPGSFPADLNADGAVNSDDLDLVRANWGRSAEDADILAVPEPSVVVLLFLAVGFVVGRPRLGRHL